MAKALDVAKFILQESEKGLSNLELQKTLYFVALDFCRKYEKHLLSDDFEAWQFGPVVREVYYEYRNYGANSIDKPEQPISLNLKDEESTLIKQTIKACNSHPYWELVKKSHREGGAWSRVYVEGEKNIIKKEYILDEARKFNG